MNKRSNTRQLEEENEYDTVPEYIDTKFYSESKSYMFKVLEII